MKKNHLTLLSLILAVGIFGVANSAFAQAGSTATGVASVVGGLLGGSFDIVGALLSPIGWLIMQLTSYITMLAGMALNASIYYSVVKMSENIGQVDGINTAWGTIRDVANMGFIFILLWAAIQKIIGIGKDTNRLIVNMIVAAILINFSLFFTKFIIDIANILALAFYKVMVPGNITSANYADVGLSNAMMDALRVSSIWQATGTTFSGGNAIIIMLLSSVVLLITAFIFFAAAIMFVIRYVVLIFVLILSPIAFISQVFPGLQGQAKKWWDALLGQAFFAPIYFLLMWVTIVVANGITSKVFLTGSASSATFGSVFSEPGSNISILINFAVIIGFLIVSLIVAKSQADKAGPVAKSMTKWAMGVAGGASFGLAGRFARGTVGRYAQRLAEDEDLKKKAPTSRLARLALATANKGAGTSFDMRSVKPLNKELEAGDAQKGGFAKDLKDKVEAEKKFAESLKPSDLAVNQAEKTLGDTKKVDITSAQFQAEYTNERMARRDAVNDAASQVGTARVKLNDARARGASADEITTLENDLRTKEEDLRGKERSLNSIGTAQQYKQSKVDAAQARVDELKGVGEDEARNREIKRIMVARGWDKKRAKEYLDRQEDARMREVERLIQTGMSEDDANKDAERRHVGWKPKTTKSASATRSEAYAKNIEEAKTFGVGNRYAGFDVSKRIGFFGPVKKEYRQGAIEIRKKMKEKSPAERLAEELSKAKDSGAATSGTPATPPTGGTGGGTGAGTGGGTPPPAPAPGSP